MFISRQCLDFLSNKHKGCSLFLYPWKKFRRREEGILQTLKLWLRFWHCGKFSSLGWELFNVHKSQVTFQDMWPCLRRLTVPRLRAALGGTWGSSSPMGRPTVRSLGLGRLPSFAQLLCDFGAVACVLWSFSDPAALGALRLLCVCSYGVTGLTD